MQHILSPPLVEISDLRYLNLEYLIFDPLKLVVEVLFFRCDGVKTGEDNHESFILYQMALASTSRVCSAWGAELQKCLQNDRIL